MTPHTTRLNYSIFQTLKPFKTILFKFKPFLFKFKPFKTMLFKIKPFKSMQFKIKPFKSMQIIKPMPIGDANDYLVQISPQIGNNPFKRIYFTIKFNIIFIIRSWHLKCVDNQAHCAKVMIVNWIVSIVNYFTFKFGQGWGLKVTPPPMYNYHTPPILSPTTQTSLSRVVGCPTFQTRKSIITHLISKSIETCYKLRYVSTLLDAFKVINYPKNTGLIDFWSELLNYNWHSQQMHLNVSL